MFEANLHSLPVHVSKIELIGLNKTDEKFIRNQIKAVETSTNLQDLLKNISSAKDNLLSFGIFSQVQALIDAGEGNGVYNVSFKMKEARQMQGSCNFTTSSDYRTNMGVNFLGKNIFGKAENVSFNQSYNIDRAATNQLVFSKPAEKTPGLKYLFSMSNSLLDAYWSQYKLHSLAFAPEIQFRTPLALHQFLLNYTWRETTVHDLRAPLTIREECGNQLKSTFGYIFNLDTKPKDVYPESGLCLKLKTDLSFLTPGDVSRAGDDEPSEDTGILTKFKTKFSKSFGLTHNLSGEFFSSFGLVHSLLGHRVPLADRFFLGGPLNLRGFDSCGVGPMAPRLQPGGSELTRGFHESKLANNPLGDCCFWLTSLHIYSRLPYFSKDPSSLASLFRIQGFLSAGNTFSDPLSDENRSNLPKSLSSITANPRISTGLGLILKVAGTIRIELNYCIPLSAQKFDFRRNGIQFGFGFIYI